MRSMTQAVRRKRARLYTQEELARILGVSARTIIRLEKAPIPERVLRYLDLIGYQVAFYPRRGDAVDDNGPGSSALR